MYETTTPDPLESTVPDPVRRRMSARRRRAIEAWALAFLVPAVLVTYFIDGRQLGRGFDLPERVTVIPRGAVATIGHTRWRMLGRVAKGDPPQAPGSVEVTLLVQVNVLDAQGVKDATRVTYQVRDGDGHLWDAEGHFPDFQDPTPGAANQATVTANVPPSLVSKVVLEVEPMVPREARSIRVLRFAH